MDERPFAIVLRLAPSPPYLSKANTALSDFEDKHFTPGTPAADQYQVVVDDTWNGPIYAIIGFPEQYLAEFAESLRGHGLALVQGFAPAGSDDGLCELGFKVDDCVYVFEPLIDELT